MRKMILILMIFMFSVMNIGFCNANEIGDGELKKAYSGGYKFFKNSQSNMVINSGKPGMVFYAIEGLTTYTIDLYDPGYVNFLIVSAAGGKNIEIIWNRYPENSGPSQQDLYDKYKKPWDKDAQARGTFANTKQLLYKADNLASKRAYDAGKDCDFSSNSNVPAIIGIWNDGTFEMYIGDDATEPIATIPCSGIYNKIETMGLNKVGVYDVPWEGYIALHSNTLVE